MGTIDAFAFPRCNARTCESDSVPVAGGLFCDAHWAFVPRYLTDWLTREWKASPSRPTRAWLRLSQAAVELVDRNESRAAARALASLH